MVPPSSTWSTARWKSESGIRRAELLRDRWAKRDVVEDEETGARVTFKQLMASMPTAKGDTLESLQAHVRYATAAWARIEEHAVRSRRVRRLRFDSHIRWWRALDRVCADITGGMAPEEAHVAFGGMSTTTGFGYFPGPIKSLVRRLRQHAHVYVINEQYTSKRCSYCAFNEALSPEERCKDLLPGRRRAPPASAAAAAAASSAEAAGAPSSGGEGHVQGGGASSTGPGAQRCGGGVRVTTEIHDVRWCSNQSCRTTWQRDSDANFARSMRLVMRAVASHPKRERPVEFAPPAASPKTLPPAGRFKHRRRILSLKGRVTAMHFA
jgi:hypothetical protein